MSRRRSWTTRGLLSAEYGSHWTDSSYWTDYIDGAGAFEMPTIFGAQSPGQGWSFFGWRNDAGASRGVRAYTKGSAPTNATTKAHSVHLRVQGSMANSLAASSWGIGPATCVHAGSAALGNCYFVNVFESAGPRIHLRRHRNGTDDLLTTFAGSVTHGDQVSLSYRYSSATAHLEVFVNGVSVGTYDDSSGSRFDMAAVSGRPGVFGHDVPVHGPSVGSWSTEWWVTDGFQSVAEIAPPYPKLAGNLQVVLKRHRRYTDDAEPQRIIIATSEILSCSWAHSRIGGCSEAEIEARFGRAVAPPEAATDRESLFVHPNATDWSDTEWMGGALEIHLRYDARDAIQPTLVWAGAVSSIAFDRADGTVSIRGDGLWRLVEQTHLTISFDNVTIRDAVIQVMQSVTKGTQATGRDYPIKYNPAKVVAPSSVMDLLIADKAYKWESAKSIMDELLALLPEGVCWGVDQDREFFLSIYGSPYTTNLQMEQPVVFYDAGSALEWRTEFRTDSIVNEVTALGQEPDDESEARTSGVAVCDKSRALYGYRRLAETLDETSDVGILAKYAQAVCKRSASPEMIAQLRVREPLAGSRTLWQSLSAINPYVAVMHRSSRVNQADPGEVPQVDYALRLIGDVSGSMPDMLGSNGAQVRFPSLLAERRSKSWLLHVTLKFTHPHPGGVGDYAFILGRPSTAGIRRGWGALAWFRTTGDIMWIQDEAGAPVLYNTGVNRDVSSPSAAPVHFTIHRKADGSLLVYNGTGATATNGANANDLAISNTDDWQFWKVGTGYSGYVAWDGAMEQFWFFDTVANGWYGDPIEGQPDLHTGFISRNNGKNLGRQEGSGCLMHLKFNERLAVATAAGRFKLWRGSPGGGGAYDATLVSAGTSGASNLSPVSTHTARGHVFSVDRRWGGPMVLLSDRVRYDADPSSGTVDISFDLMSRPADLSRSVEAIREELRRQTEAMRRIRQDITE